MKTALLVIGGFCAALAAFAISESKKKQPVEALAHKLEVAWADHHTVV